MLGTHNHRPLEYGSPLSRGRPEPRGTSVAELPKLSVRLSGAVDPRHCVDLANIAFSRGVLPAASACAAATRRIGIGIGVFNPYNRHPTLIAMEIGALDELAQRRARLAIGSGIAAATERMG